jgi:hypothetical protein
LKKFCYWSPWALIGWKILNFFMKAFSYEFATLARNVPLGIQFWWTIFASERLEMQKGRHDLWLAEALLASFAELPHMNSSDRPEEFWRSVASIS